MIVRSVGGSTTRGDGPRLQGPRHATPHVTREGAKAKRLYKADEMDSSYKKTILVFSPALSIAVLVGKGPFLEVGCTDEGFAC